MSESGPERPSLEKIDLENSEEDKKARHNSLKQRAINASNKFRTSFSKKSRRNSKVMSVVVEDEHDAEDLKAVEALRQALIAEDLLPEKHDDYHLLLRSQYLRSKNWNTRVAAAHAIGTIAGCFKHSSMTELYNLVEAKMKEAGINCATEDEVLWPKSHPKISASTSFQSFELTKVLEFGSLLASGGQEFEVANDFTNNPKERLAKQKQNLKWLLDGPLQRPIAHGSEKGLSRLQGNAFRDDTVTLLDLLLVAGNGIPMHTFLLWF